jgi:LuxR family maltose regulon positive regulatory protein
MQTSCGNGAGRRHDVGYLGDEPDRAELRLLPYLATHLTFAQIGRRLFISPNSVKAEASSIYRKLGASCRNTAIEHAVDVGLLESTVYPPRPEET